MTEVAKLKAVLAAIEEVEEAWDRHYATVDDEDATGPEGPHWDQSTWVSVPSEESSACGTALCFAGWAIWLEGYKIPLAQPGGSALANASGDVVRGDEIAFKAQMVLGLDYEWARLLFSSQNDLEDLRRYVDEIVADSGGTVDA